MPIATDITFWPTRGFFVPGATERFGARFGDKGTHTSRTLMLAELSDVLDATSPDATRRHYAAAVIEANCLGKPTASSRVLTNQRLGELYALDPSVPLFRALRRLWPTDPKGRPLLALLVALARDPLLAASASAVLSLPEGAELLRDPVRSALRKVTAERLNDATLDKVARNVASSWSQAGHLAGRTFKRRRLVEATAASAAFALFIAHAAGFRGNEMLASGWVTALDTTPSEAQGLALEAKRLGLIDLRAAGDVFEVAFERLAQTPGRS